MASRYVGGFSFSKESVEQMAIIVDELLVCQDCYVMIANGDPSGVRPEDLHAIESGMDRLAKRGHLSATFDEDRELEFSRYDCACCNSGLAGSRHPVVILGS